jgi:hypothetical protein
MQASMRQLAAIPQVHRVCSMHRAGVCMHLQLATLRGVVPCRLVVLGLALDQVRLGAEQRPDPLHVPRDDALHEHILLALRVAQL